MQSNTETTRVPSVIDHADLLDLDLNIVEGDTNPNLGTTEERLRAGGSTSTCVTYWAASRCPSCW